MVESTVSENQCNLLSFSKILTGKIVDIGESMGSVEYAAFDPVFWLQ